MKGLRNYYTRRAKDMSNPLLTGMRITSYAVVFFAKTDPLSSLFEQTDRQNMVNLQKLLMQCLISDCIILVDVGLTLITTLIFLIRAY